MTMSELALFGVVEQLLQRTALGDIVGARADSLIRVYAR